MSDLATIVAEVIKEWPNDDSTPICKKFEHAIEVNRVRGYRLQSWQFFSTFHDSENRPRLTETIIAVFTRSEVS